MSDSEPSSFMRWRTRFASKSHVIPESINKSCLLMLWLGMVHLTGCVVD
jgi:hypothetical protein